MVIEAQHLLHSPAGPEWRYVGVRHHHGINLPLFSLRSKESCGIGEFPDLIPLFDWCKSLGIDIIQLLPLNDNGPDTSPYCALSAIALNPMHLGLSNLPYLDKVPDLEVYFKEMREFNATQRIDYAGLYSARERFLKHYYHHAGPLITSSYNYLVFLSRFPWIESYALFKALKIDQHWRSWQQWPEEMRDAGPKEDLTLLRQFKEEVAFQRCIQYLCFQQLQQIKKIAEEKGIFLKGDIPILINFESADVWRQRQLFILDQAAGAPPDMYAEEGQRWGFPLYNWDAHEKEHYMWWKTRLNVASYFYHIYRIDHIVGFYRIWGIPQGKLAKEGHYVPHDKSQWIPQGDKVLTMMLDNTKMLPIGEDLGTVPPEVRKNMLKLGICGTKVMRWERRWDTDKAFIPVQDYPLESMTTVSTHDSETLQLWWKNQVEEAQEYAKFKGWDYSPELPLERHREILSDSHHSGSLFHVNLLNEYLALVPGLTWPALEDERINIPGTISDFNWSYRFRPTVEEIISNDSLKKIMQNILA